MKDLSMEEFEVMLCSTGYLPPRNEEELVFFSQMYEGHKSRLENRHVDVDSIVNGSCRIVSFHSALEEQETSCSMVAEDFDDRYSMAARNFGKLPKDVLDKMKSQHKRDNDNED